MPVASAPVERESQPIVARNVKVGDLMASINYVRVKQVNNGGQELVTEDLLNGFQSLTITGKDLVESCLSANQFQKEMKITKTQAAELLISSYNRPFTVVFEKQDGTERTLRGRLIRPEPLLGRSMVEDMETTDKNKERLVDHRTIKSLIVDGIKYVVK
jgi:hypothetical protein